MTNSILQKPSSIQACIDSGSSIRACIDSSPPLEHVLTQVWTSTFSIVFYKWVYVMASSNDVIASKYLLIWKLLIKRFHLRYYTIWFLQFQNLNLGYTIFDPSANHEDHGRSPLKLFSWVAGQVLLSHQVWSWSVQKYSKNKVFISIITWPNFDLDRWPWPLSFSMMVAITQILLCANDDVP
jgi:hypothetical protein